MLILLACDEGESHQANPSRASELPADTLYGDTETTSDTTYAHDTASDDEALPGDSGDSGSGGSGVVCGDAACDADESCWSCASDCGACDCPADVEAVYYTQSAWNVLADALAANPSYCADYYIHIPAPTTDKTWPRDGGEPAAMRARSSRFHAMAELHWATWEAEAGTWYDKGVLFREHMALRGYDVAAGDTWAINELPSTVRSDDAVREDVVELMRGLYDGPSGAPAVQGAVFITGMGQGTVYLATYEGYVRDWLEDQSFWEQANNYARWWGQEVYTDPSYVCVDDTTVAERSSAVNTFIQHVARHAEVGPDEANTAQSYLGRAYLPLMNAVWQASAGYGDTDITLEQMQHHVSTQVYAARSWSNSHNYPDGRLGFAWARSDGVTDADLTVLADRMAAAIHGAYDEGGGSAQYACSPSGAYTWCACDVDGAEFNAGWDTFSEW